MPFTLADLERLMESTTPADHHPPAAPDPSARPADTDGVEARPPLAPPGRPDDPDDANAPRGATPKHSARPGQGPAQAVPAPRRTVSHIPSFVREGINLASARLGARVVAVTDEFFAPAHRMLSPENPVWKEGVFDDHGKWMDGWESRRRRTPGHDHCTVALACAGTIMGFSVDTAYFTGNYPPEVSIEGARLDTVAAVPDEATEWTAILPRRPLGPNANHFFYGEKPGRIFTHLRVHIYPDGGIARLRAYGTPLFDWARVDDEERVDLVHAFHGGRSLAHSDAHYGHPERMLGPGRGVNMGDGWETARRRGPGYDWTVLRLGHPGQIERIVVDTAHFKGNYPHHCTLRGLLIRDEEDEVPPPETWPVILEDRTLGPDAVHEFAVDRVEPVSHVRFEIHPDGGVSRLRLIGTKWTRAEWTRAE